MPISAVLAAPRHNLAKVHLVQRVALGLAATLVLALSAHVALPLPFTPVPLSLQPLAVLTAGLLLGPVDGALTLVAYLTEGALGLPVFSPTGPGGVLQLFGPTGGYLLADPLVAFLAGYFACKLSGRFGAYAAALTGCILATAVLFLAGATWLAHLHPMSAHTLWIAAIAPFLPGEAVKIFVAAGIFRTFHSRFAR